MRRLRTLCVVPSPFIKFYQGSSKQFCRHDPSLLCAGCGLRARCPRRSRDSIKACRPWRVRRTCFVISLVISIASHISGLPLKFSFGFSLGQLGSFIVVFIVSHIPGLALKFSLLGSSRRIFHTWTCLTSPFFKIRSVSTWLSLPSLPRCFFHVALFQI